MSSLFGIAANGASAFYNGATSASMRFRRGIGSNTEINFDPSSAGNAQKHTISVWVKRTKPSDGSQVLLGAFQSSYSDFLYFRSDDRLEYTLGNAYSVATNMKFRDTANWYHIVTHFDVANSTTTDRLKFYVNGVEQTKTVTYGSYPANNNYGFSTTNDHTIGGLTHFGGYELDGYLCDYHFIDGSLVSHNSFGEFKNGVWIPKIVNTSAITYGTNGFRLEFKGTDTDGPSTSGSVNSNSVGASSVNSNHFHAYSTNQQYHSALPDNPENNFSTWNPLFRGGEKSSSIYATSTLSEGALKVSVPTNSYMGNTFRPISGKWYMEMRVTTVGSSNLEIDWGWIQATEYSGNTGHAGQANKWGVFAYQTHIRLYDETSQLGSNISVTVSAGDILQLAWDIDNNKGWVGINNTWYRTNASDGNPSAGTNEAFTFTSEEAQNLQCYIANGTSTDVHVANFGQDGSFAGGLTGGNIGTASDANGIGAFKYAPPTGFLALCSANLPDTDLSPNQLEQATDFFNTILYTGNNTSRSIAVGFQPDWTWIKSRSNTSDHYVYDSNRGTPNKSLSTNDSGTEDNTSGQFTQFTATGFDLPADTAGYVNYNSRTYAAWNWRVNGGTTSTDNNGSLTSTVQTNSKAGISIATFTVPTQANFSFGHGLGSVPEMFWWKSRTTTQNWIVYHPAKTTSVPGAPGIYLNNSLAGFATGGSWITELSSTRIAITDGKVSSGSNRDDVVYSFKSVEGFSKIGSYTGNASTDGTFIYTGFRPAWVILKRINAAGHWLIFDNKRDGYNPDAAELKADDQAAEVEFDRIDFISNGFKQRYNGTDNNGSGSTYVYMAFAEQPFKFTNAR